MISNFVDSDQVFSDPLRKKSPSVQVAMAGAGNGATSILHEWLSAACCNGEATQHSFIQADKVENPDYAEYGGFYNQPKMLSSYSHTIFPLHESPDIPEGIMFRAFDFPETMSDDDDDKSIIRIPTIDGDEEGSLEVYVFPNSELERIVFK